jgi:hypothetical protein
MTRLVALQLLILVVGCATAPDPAPTPAPAHAYDGIREPAAFAPKIEQAQPVVPPKAAPVTESAPDPCDALCSALDSANNECGSLTMSCKRYASENNDVCRNKNKVCNEADTAQRRASKCSCS